MVIRYHAFMTMMSTGIAVLGLLLSSPAVVIGAMLISPLNPILTRLPVSRWRCSTSPRMRRSLVALAIGTLAAVVFTVMIVMASPAQATTAEILADRPSLFRPLLVCAVRGPSEFAVIRGRGETIVGVAIATALMPPLAVVGYAMQWNMPVLAGSTAVRHQLCHDRAGEDDPARFLRLRPFPFGELKGTDGAAYCVRRHGGATGDFIERIARESLNHQSVRNTLAGSGRCPRYPTRNRLTPIRC
jgi:hypothetical protein